MDGFFPFEAGAIIQQLFSFDSQGVQPGDEGGGAEVEEFSGSARAVDFSAAFAKRGFDGGLLGFQPLFLREGRRYLRFFGRGFQWLQMEMQRASFGENDRTLNHGL